MTDQPRPPLGGDARPVLQAGAALLADGMWLASTLDAARRAVIDAHRVLAEPQIRPRLAELGIERLRESTGGRVRLAGLPEAGFLTVGDLVDADPARLDAVPGIGPQTARTLRAAAQQIADAVAASVQVRVENDPENRQTTPLVVAVARLARLLPAAKTLKVLPDQVVPALQHDVAAAAPTASRIGWLFTGRDRKDAATIAYWRVDQAARWASENRIADRVAAVRAIAEAPPTAAEAWSWFAADPSAFYTLLGETVGLRLDVAAVEGYLPSEIVERIQALRLDDEYSNVNLRGYQSFGTKFALVQKRVILGDEMGLGKTIQALAGLAHLRAQGQTLFLVVCPASVIVNWLREIRRHSRLVEFRLHGDGRDGALNEWLARGGVAVTTYDTAGALDLPADLRIAALIVDEAHLVKNPEAKRSQLVGRLGKQADHVWYLTGTPMENRVEEFRRLIKRLRPAVELDFSAVDALAGPARFRAAVAPVYLRRNADDVLLELPELVRKDEWCEFTVAERRAYDDAVRSGNFSAMRRASFSSTDPVACSKINRLLNLVSTALANGRRVVVFSYFLSTLATVTAALRESGVCPEVLGPLTGSTPAAERQAMVDALSAPDGPRVLVAQIQAGGVGLNMQAASVVIICEPQVKPTMETQAIARTHRMGQLNNVTVHRLLTDDTADERMVEILDVKTELFDAYARPSAMADATPAAVDISEVALARQVVAAEQSRLQLPLR